MKTIKKAGSLFLAADGSPGPRAVMVRFDCGKGYGRLFHMREEY